MDPQSRKPYGTDLTDAQWKILEPLVPTAQPVLMPAKYPLREIINAILYVDRTGCPWRMLPHDFPPWESVYGYFSRWRKDGTWQRIHAALRRQLRERAGRSPEPTAAILDSQTAKTTEAGGPCGYDAGKKVKVRKRHVLVDVIGLVLAVLVLPANIQDRDGGWSVLSTLHQTIPSITKLWADGSYAGGFVQRAHDELNIDVEIVKTPLDAHTFKVLPRRWVVERTFGWLNRERRLSKDYERLPGTTEAFVQVSMVRLMVRRLARPPRALPLVEAALPNGAPQHNTLPTTEPESSSCAITA